MKRTIILTLIITIAVVIGILLIAPNPTPTDAQWEEYLEWEETFFEWRDTIAPEKCRYNIIDSLGNVCYSGTLPECKALLQDYTDCTIMPRGD